MINHPIFTPITSTFILHLKCCPPMPQLPTPLSATSCLPTSHCSIIIPALPHYTTSSLAIDKIRMPRK